MDFRRYIDDISVLHIAECAGGVERYIQMLVPRLNSRGIRQYFVCSKEYDVQGYSGFCDATEQLDLSRTFNPISIIRTIHNVRTLIKKYRPNIVYCHSSYAGAFGRIAAIGLPCRVLYNPHGWAFKALSFSELKRGVFLLAEILLSFFTDKIICISEAERNAAIRKRVCSEKKTVFIENGVDIPKVKNATPIDRGTLGLHQSDFVIGMAGRISAQKAPDTFIKAAKLISYRISNAAFVIIGDGEDRKKIENYAKENNVKLRITGWVDNPYSYMKIFDVALVLSRWEGLSLVVPEFMASRVSVIGTRIDSIVPIIQDGENGLLVNVDDPEDSLEKVLFLYNNPDKANYMKTNAYEEVGRFDITRVAEQTLQLINTILD